jgi:hypothetical protein
MSLMSRLRFAYLDVIGARQATRSAMVLVTETLDRWSGHGA